MRSIDEFRSGLRATPQGQSRIAELKGIAQESPRMAALTGSESWDHFLRYIEAQIKMAEAEIDAKRMQAANLVLVDEAKAKAAAVQVTVLESRAATLREVILLPKWLIEQGARAGKLVAALEAEV
jgi:hypothetical protein